MKILDYLYYKLYRASLVGSAKDIAEWAAMIYVSGLIGVNIVIIGAFLRKIDLLPFYFSGKRQVILFMLCLFVLGYFIFLDKKRYKQIIALYQDENEGQRKRGNLMVWVYVITSFICIFAVAFYKPGKT